MCIDAKTSMQTFLIGGISGVLLSKYKKYKYLSVLVISVAFMQLAEYFMWIDINCKNNLKKGIYSIFFLRRHRIKGYYILY